jgi:alkanesulfonate monooxygenase SsuD/methylene tetrahydromethanopterin reductase-like flavin-dependent oxidoreductase (luciferase family)
MLHPRLDLGLMFSFRNPAAWRRPFTETYRNELALIEEAERLGYDTIWLTEHHFADDGYSPSIIPIAAAVAARRWQPVVAAPPRTRHLGRAVGTAAVRHRSRG